MATKVSKPPQEILEKQIDSLRQERAKVVLSGELKKAVTLKPR